MVPSVIVIGDVLIITLPDDIIYLTACLALIDKDANHDLYRS